MDYRNKDVADWNDIAPDKMGELRVGIGKNTKKGILAGSIACEIFETAELNIEEAFPREDSSLIYVLEEIPQPLKITALILDWGGQPTGQFLKNTERYIIPIQMLATTRIKKTKAQIKKEGGWDAKRIEDLLIPSLTNGIDSYAVDLARASVTATGESITCDSFIPSKLDIIQATQSVMSGNSSPSKILMRKDDFVAIMMAEDQSDINITLGIGTPKRNQSLEGTYESFIADSIAAKTIQARCEGLRIVLPLDDDVLKPGEMYVFTTRENLGKMYHGEAEFAFELRFGMAQWQADIEYGMNIFNVYGVSRMQVKRLESITLEEEPEQSVSIIQRMLSFIGIKRRREI
jgi:hypothetical protein